MAASTNAPFGKNPRVRVLTFPRVIIFGNNGEFGGRGSTLGLSDAAVRSVFMCAPDPHNGNERTARTYGCGGRVNTSRHKTRQPPGGEGRGISSEPFLRA